MNRIIIAHLYQPGTAATNRIIAYALGFSSKGTPVSLILGSQDEYEVPSFAEDANICVNMVQAPHGYKLNLAMVNAVKEHYIDGSTVILIYGSPVLCWFLPKNKYNIFYECTEVPFYGRKKNVVSVIKEKIKTYLSKRATGMFVISKALKDYFSEQGIANITVINMFVDSTRFERAQFTNENEKYIAYCGTISPFKDGVDCLIKAFSLFYRSHPNYKLKLIGRFESKDAEMQLMKLVEDLNLSQVVQFTGMVDPNNMPSLLCAAQILALARPDNEQARYGFPTKLGEYLATGKPVVVTNVGEIGCFLKDGENCKMAKPDDEKDFAEKMAWVVDNYEEALQIGEKGKELTKTEFSSNVQSKKALDFMQTIVEKR